MDSVPGGVFPSRYSGYGEREYIVERTLIHLSPYGRLVK